MLTLGVARLAGAAPANDNFADRFLIAGTNVTAQSDLDGATREPDEPRPSADFGASVWWEWTAPFAGGVAVESIAPIVTALAVFTGDTLSSLNLLASNPGYPGPTRLSFRAQTGERYQILVAATGAPGGTVTLRINPGPLNDDFAGRQAATLNVASLGTLHGATHEPGEPIHTSQGAGASVWWQWTASFGGNVLAIAQTPDASAALAVYTGDTLSTLSPVPVNAYTRTAETGASFRAEADVTYSFAVEQTGGLPGPVKLVLRHGPDNDYFANRLPLADADITLRVTLLGATHEPGEPNPHKFAPGASAWWEWTAPFSGGVAVECSSSAMFPGVAVFAGDTLTNLTLLAAAWRGPNDPARIGFRAQAGERYVIALDSLETPAGLVTLRLRPGPGNDDFAQRTLLTGANPTAAATLHGATRELAEPVHSAEATGRSVWWQWAAPADGPVFVEVNNPGVALAIYTGDALASLARVPSMTSRDLAVTRTLFTALAGTNYSVAAEDEGSGLVPLTLRLKPGPSNDQFADRFPLVGTDAMATASFAGATHEAGEPNPNQTSPGASLWWEWTAPFGGGVAVEAASTGSPPVLAVFTGDSLATLRLLTAQPWGNPSRTGFRADAGGRYLVAVDAAGVASGTVTLRFKPGPPNDDFANRALITGTDATVAGSLHGATGEPGEPVHWSSNRIASVWWEWTAPLTSSIAVELLDEVFANVSVYRGTALTDLVRLAADVSGGGNARVSFRAVAGQTYFFAVDDAASTSASIALRLRPGPANDDFVNVTPLTGGPLTLNATTLGATTEPGEPGFGLNPRHTVWYAWTAPAEGGWEVETRAGWHGATAAVCVGDALINLVARAIAAAGPEETARAPFRVTAGETLFIVVNGKKDGGDAFTLTLARGAANDDFANRGVITKLNASYSANTTGATRELGEPLHNGRAQGRSVWWEWTAPTTGGFWVDCRNAGGVPFVGVYEGEALDRLALTPGNRVGSETATQRAFHAIAGRTYFIVLDDPSTLPRSLSFTLRAGPTNDDLAAAQRIEQLDSPISGTTVGATSEPGEPEVRNGPGATVWFVWTAPVAGNYVVRAKSSEAPIVVATFTGTAVDDLVEVAHGEVEIAPAESRAGLQALAGMSFFIAVDSTSQFTLQVSAAAANDDFAAATPLAGPTATHTVPDFLATRELDEPIVGSLSEAPSLWWKWIAPATGGVEVRAEHDYGWVGLAVFTGTEVANLLPAVPALVEIDDVSTIFFHAAEGVEYAIGLWQPRSYGGPVTISLRPGVPNDSFAARAVLDGLPAIASLTLRGASRELGEPAPPELGEAGTVWWEWRAPSPGSFFVQAQLGFATDVAVGVFVGGAMSDLTLLAAGRATLPDRRARAAIRATAGTKYFFAAALEPTDEDALLTITVEAGPANDDFTNRSPLTGLLVTPVGTTLGATREPGEPAHGGRETGASVWFTWMAPQSGRFIASVASTVSLFVGVFTGDVLGALTPVERLAGAGFPGSLGAGRFSFEAAAGATYQIVVDSSADAMGTFTLRLGPAPPNDHFAARIFLAGTNVTATGANVNATIELGEDIGVGGLNSVWWAWIAPSDGLGRLTVQPSETNLSPWVGVSFERPDPKFTDVATLGPRGATNLTAGTFAVNGGLTYDFRVTTRSGDSTNLLLTLTFEPAPALSGDWADGRFAWLRGGNTLWFQQSAVVHEAPDALQSGHFDSLAPPGPRIELFPVGESWIQTTLSGPGTLKFWWKVSTSPFNRLSCGVLTTPASRLPLVDPAHISISGERDWELRTVPLANRTNVVRWTYTKSSTRVAGQDAAWLDAVVLEATPPKPFNFAPPRIQPDGTLSLTLNAERQRLYRVQTSRNLLNWLDQGQVFSPVTGPLRIPLPLDADAPVKFFRAMVEE